MDTLQSIYKLAREINDSWGKNESVDWSEAEHLVREFKEIPDHLLSQMPEIINIISYAETNEDWDSSEVASWPDTICEAVEYFDKSYHYRENSDDWEVFSLALTGEEEWKATVETEKIAERLVTLMNNEGCHKEIFLSATKMEILDVCMADVVGDYDVPEEVEEWEWVEEKACYNHHQNGQDGIWEFVLNLTYGIENVPEKLKPVIMAANKAGANYLLFHQGT